MTEITAPSTDQEVIEAKYGNTTFQITSKYIGNMTLEDVIKRLIQEEVENQHLHSN